MIFLENKTETIDKDENKNLLFLKVKISKNSLGNFVNLKLKKNIIQYWIIELIY